MSGSTTNTFFTFTSAPKHAAMALRASPGTRWRNATRTLKFPPLDVVAWTATGSRTAFCSACQITTSVRTAVSAAVSVRLMARPPMVAV